MADTRDPQIHIVGARTRGRPRLSEEPMEPISVRVPKSCYDKLFARSVSTRESLATTVRNILAKSES